MHYKLHVLFNTLYSTVAIQYIFSLKFHLPIKLEEFLLFQDVWLQQILINALYYINFNMTLYSNGDRSITVVKVLCCKSEGHLFDPSLCQ